MPRYYTLIAALTLVITGFCLYANSVSNDFVWDDRNLIVNNPDIKAINWKNIKTIFTRDLVHFVDRTNFYRPVQSLIYMVGYRLWDGHPQGYRLLNIALHCLNGLLIFIIVRLILHDAVASLFGALLFIVHPLQTSAVAYISGTADVGAMACLLVAVFFMARFKKTGGIFDAAFALIAFCKALLAKEICVVFPPVAFFLYTRGLTDKQSRLEPREKIFFCALFCLALIYLGLRLTVLKFAPLGSQAINAPPLYRRFLMLWPVLFTYLRLIILPYDLRMDRDIAVPMSVFQPAVFFSILAIAAAAFVVWRYAAKDKPLVVGIVWFLAFLFPSLNIIVPLNAPISEHWLYIPFLGISLAAAYGITRLVGRYRAAEKIIYGILIAAMVVYGGTTIYLNKQWKSEKTLFSYIVRYSSVHARAHYNLGCRYLDEKKFREAITELEKAAQKDPNYYEPLVAMSIAYVKLGDLDAGRAAFKKAIAMRPDSVDGYLVVAQALSDVGKHDDAIAIYQAALRIDEKSPAAYNGLGVAYASKGVYANAKEAWESALKIKPDFKEAAANLKRLEDILASNPIEGYLASVNKLASQGNYAAAIEECKKAIAIDEKNLTVHNNLGVLYGMVGDDERAIAEFRRVLELDPNEPGTYKNIAIIESKYPEKYPEAIEYFQKYLKFSTSEEERAIIQKKIEEMQGIKK